jgi:hypothetical protein
MLYTDVPEDARNDVARKVADKILDKLKEEHVPSQKPTFDIRQLPGCTDDGVHRPS